MEHRNTRGIALSRSSWLLVPSLLASLVFADAARAEDAKDVDGSKASVQEVVPSGVVNINTATEEELTRLPGIGPKKAQAILKQRESAGSFKDLEGLLRVRGIGRKTLRKLSPMITLSGPTTMSAPQARRRSGATK